VNFSTKLHKLESWSVHALDNQPTLAITSFVLLFASPQWPWTHQLNHNVVLGNPHPTHRSWTTTAIKRSEIGFLKPRKPKHQLKWQQQMYHYHTHCQYEHVGLLIEEKLAKHKIQPWRWLFPKFVWLSQFLFFFSNHVQRVVYAWLGPLCTTHSNQGRKVPPMRGVELG
jgi:hypothetical protein